MQKALVVNPMYEITDDGQVWSNYTNKFLKGDIDINGYVIVRLAINKRVYKKFRVHRLVAEAFIPNPNNKPFINHLNGIRNDNRAVNLEWCTQSENMIHANLGDKNQENKEKARELIKAVIENNKIKIAQCDCSGNIICIYNSIKDAEKATGINHRNISQVRLGRRKTAGGFIWKTVE